LDDSKKTNGAEWIKCTFYRVWYHATYQKVVDELHFMCDGCEDSDDSKQSFYVYTKGQYW